MTPPDFEKMARELKAKNWASLPHANGVHEVVALTEERLAAELRKAYDLAIGACVVAIEASEECERSAELYVVDVEQIRALKVGGKT